MNSELLEKYFRDQCSAEVLATISKTFDIQHEINGNTVVWTE